MEPVLRATIVYAAMLVIFRIAGRRTLAQLTNFDFILLLIIGESIQNALLGNDFSITNAMVVVVTLIFLNIVVSFLKQFVPGFERVADGGPFVIVADGVPLRSRMNISRVDDSDVLEAARQKMGLERMEQIKYAVLEKTGDISIIPKT